MNWSINLRVNADWSHTNVKDVYSHPSRPVLLFIILKKISFHWLQFFRHQCREKFIHLSLPKCSCLSGFSNALVLAHIQWERKTQQRCYSWTAGKESYYGITHKWFNTKQPSACLIALVPSPFSVCYIWFLSFYIPVNISSSNLITHSFNKWWMLFLVTKNTFSSKLRFK